MTRWILASALALAVLLTGNAIAAEPQVAHMVYFKLKDHSEAATNKFLAGCHKYLDKHEGTVYFSVGTLAKDLVRDVNDTDFDVALHMVFKNRAAHDKYQDDPRHSQFIDEFKDSWAGVRVFDSYIPAPAGDK
jgi:quinol monooxygenase YgiN